MPARSAGIFIKRQFLIATLLHLIRPTNDVSKITPLPAHPPGPVAPRFSPVANQTVSQ